MDVRRFLKGIGMQRYEQVVIDNGIDEMSVFREASEIQLKEIGILVGHRIKILKALRGETSEKPLEVEWDFMGDTEKNFRTSDLKTTKKEFLN